MRNPGSGEGVWCVCLCFYVSGYVCALRHVRQEHTSLLVDGPGETANRRSLCLGQWLRAWGGLARAWAPPWPGCGLGPALWVSAFPWEEGRCG